MPSQPVNLHAFAPDAARARFLDQRMRSRLAQSLRYIFAEAKGSLDLPGEQAESFLQRLEKGPAAPLAFTLYSESVLAFEEDDHEKACRLLGRLVELAPPPGGPAVQDLADPKVDWKSEYYLRAIDTDPTMSFEVFPPSASASAGCRAQIKSAFELMDEGDPELAAEIRALLREIILAAGSEDPKAFTFDGASSFMLWGAIVINANRKDGELAMVQMLAHESAHNLMFGFSADEPLVENPPEEVFPSPLRADLRPMDGIYHATFVTARMHRAVSTLLQSGILSPTQKIFALKELLDNRRLFDQGIATVQKHARLTEIGAAVMRGAIDYMARADS